MRLILTLLAALTLTACAAFTEPMYASPEAEQAECERSAWCRALINDRPAWTVRYHSDREDCQAHAREIAEQARADGLHVTFAVGDMIKDRHVVAVVLGTDGTMWAYDNGRIASQPFNPKELSHWMRRIHWVNDLQHAL